MNVLHPVSNDASKTGHSAALLYFNVCFVNMTQKRVLHFPSTYCASIVPMCFLENVFDPPRVKVNY